MARVAREHNVATQMGNGGQAAESVRIVAEMVADGWIGRVKEVHRWTNRPIWPQGIDRPRDTPPAPSTLDWDLWIGPAPMRPYHPAYVPFKWRGWWDFGTGALGDMGCHYFHPIFVALNLGHPQSVEADCSPVNSETYPASSTVTYQFPAKDGRPPVKVVWYDGGRLPKRPAELDPAQELSPGGGVYYSGDRGTIFDGRLIPEARRREAGRPTRRLPRSPGHYVEWINACKGGPPAGSNFDMASMVTQTVLLGNIAIRTGHRLEWDAANMKITNLPEANRFLHRQYRQGWSL
jgi:predicted dehydrogenase